MKILLIDDSEIDNFINKAIISKSNLVTDVVTKNSGNQALEYLLGIKDDLERFPDVIFLDIRMPGMDGYEFMEHYKNLSEILRSKCKVFVLSSSTSPTDVERSESYTDIQKHLGKPLAHHPIEALLVNNS